MDKEMSELVILTEKTEVLFPVLYSNLHGQGWLYLNGMGYVRKCYLSFYYLSYYWSIPSWISELHLISTFNYFSSRFDDLNLLVLQSTNYITCLELIINYLPLPKKKKRKEQEKVYIVCLMKIISTFCPSYKEPSALNPLNFILFSPCK